MPGTGKPPALCVTHGLRRTASENARRAAPRGEALRRITRKRRKFCPQHCAAQSCSAQAPGCTSLATGQTFDPWTDFRGRPARVPEKNAIHVPIRRTESSRPRRHQAPLEAPRHPWLANPAGTFVCRRSSSLTRHRVASENHPASPGLPARHNLPECHIDRIIAAGAKARLSGTR